jgi:hypothetical protein
VQQRHGQQRGFLMRLQTDGDRLGTTVQVDAEQADGMGGSYRQLAESLEQFAGGIIRQALSNRASYLLPNLESYRKLVNIIN